VLYNFCSASNCTDGRFPEAGLIMDKAGNLYGTTYWGGAGACVYVCGTAFELIPGANGAWTEKVLYSFCSASACADGGGPQAGLILDAAGNLYGTTGGGGSTAQNCGSHGCGTVFELLPGTNGTWTENVLHTFGTGNDGVSPYAGLIFDKAGNLYGTTTRGGRPGCSYGCGTVFEMTPGAGGTWKEKVLYNPQSRYGGDLPAAGLVPDAQGNLYGTTSRGGGFNGGTAFELVRGSSGTWKAKVLHSFGPGKGGSGPAAGLIMDAAGNLYGTTEYGGFYGAGAVFELSPEAGGTWSEKKLHSFCSVGYCTDGAEPVAGLIFDAAGNLYGTAKAGGNSTQFGTVFEIAP
jgi:uncharacterized repeat protein (TIGR03803 family)